MAATSVALSERELDALVAPALLSMVVLLQAYTKASDAEAVELSVVDARWQMVLDVAGDDEPPFSQGALQAFRQRLIAHDMDRRLLERTVELAKQTGIFDWKKLPKDLRLAIDSRPIEGVGRVEDTFNLLAHAARQLIVCTARVLQRPVDEVADEAGAPLLVQSSIKRALDIEWSDPEQKASAIVTLVEQLDRLQAWIERNLAEKAALPPIAEHVETLRQLREQDLEPDPDGGGKPRIRRGVAEDRRVSVGSVRNFVDEPAVSNRGRKPLCQSQRTKYPKTGSCPRADVRRVVQTSCWMS